MSDPRIAALQAQADHLLTRGPLGPAIEAHRALLAADPRRPDAWYNLGHLLTRAGRPEEALDAYDRALHHGITAPEEVHLNRAVLLTEALERHVEAFAELHRGLALAPLHVGLLTNLGNLHEQHGDAAQAAQAYREAMDADPSAATLALSRWLGLQAPGAARQPAMAQVRRALARPGLGDAEQADLGFALAAALDAEGRHDDAFDAALRANAASQRLGGRPYDPAAVERWVDARIAGPAEALPAVAPDAPPRVFICGLFRSGSTLAEAILAGHPRVTAGGELEWLPALARHEDSLPPPASAAEAEARLQGMRRAYDDALARRFPGHDIVTDKRPDNAMHIGLMLRLYPHARIVHTTRHPLDNAVSLFFLHLDTRMPWATSLDGIAHWMVQQRRLMAHWTSRFGPSIHTLRHEALVADPPAEVDALLRHVGLAPHPDCLQFHQRAGVVKTPSNWQIRQPLNGRAHGRWRPYADRLKPLIDRLADAGFTDLG